MGERSVPSRLSSITALLLVALCLVSLAVLPSAVAGQEETEVYLEEATIDVDADETSTVVGEYRFAVEAAEGGVPDISGTLWNAPDGSVEVVSTAVDGEEVDPQVDEASEHTALAVPVDAEEGDTVTVTVEHEVTGQSGELYVPLWVPEAPTPGESPDVLITVTLPDGQHPQGDAFPDPDRIDGNVVEYDSLHAPSFVKMSYADGEPGLLTMNAMYSWLGVGLILLLTVGGLLVDRRTAETQEG